MTTPKQRIVYASTAEAAARHGNDAIAQGWRVVSITAEHVSSGNGSFSTSQAGAFLILLEKD